MNQLKIGVKLEGGLGDCLLANRFIPAIRDFHKNSKITCFFDNNRSETFQLEVLKKFYPSFYDEFHLIDQFDKNNFDYFYNLHIDKMEWTKYEFDWLSRFYYFPKPEIEIKKENHICVHLTHNKWPPKNLDKKYINELICEISKVHKKIKAICTQSEASSYSDVLDKVELVISSVNDACLTVASSMAFITIDSGFKYMAYANGVPTIETSDYHTNFGYVNPLIKARWIPFCERGVPLYESPKTFSLILSNLLDNKISSIFPFHMSNKQTFNL